MNSNSTANLVENGDAVDEPKKKKEKQKNLYRHQNLANPTTDFETLAHLLKGSMVFGVLAMPSAFANAGLLVGLAATVFTGAVAAYSVNILVSCATYLCKRRQLPSLGLADIAEVAFLEGPPSLRKYAAIAKFVVDFFLFAELWGTCCAYIVFVGYNLKRVMDLYTDVRYGLRVYMACLLPPLIVVNQIRSLKRLAPLSMVADACMVTALGVIICYLVQDLPPPDTRPAFAPIGRLPLFFGTAIIFAVEGIGVVMQLKNNMKTPEHFLGCPGVLNIGMAIVVVLNSAVGFLGYLRFGPHTLGSITLNLPDEPLTRSVMVMIAVAIFFTYALQFFLLVNIARNVVKKHFTRWPDLAERSLRTVLVLLSVIVAILVPNLVPFISLVRAIYLPSLGLVFPSVVELVVFWDSPGRGNWFLWKNIMVICFGLVGIFTGTYQSVQDMIEAYIH